MSGAGELRRCRRRRCLGLGLVLDVAESESVDDRPEDARRHQFHLPIRRMVAGTRRTRTIVASTATAIAIPTPMLLIVMTSASANAAKTDTMIRAAPVI